MAKSSLSHSRASTDRKLHCFVAMAFGKADTDAIYTHQISKAIQDAGMIPVRVDRVIHNERIDSKIRDLIRKADVAVADLTYARPSVYWEAGYAERLVPVVYTCRADHLHPQTDDKYGNLQVHFDLRNANLITWSGYGDKRFREALRKTLLHVTRQSRIDAKREQQMRIEREKFLPMSAEERNHLVNEETTKILGRHGFYELGYTFSNKDEGRPSFFNSGISGRILYQIYWKRIRSAALLILRMPCVPQLTQSMLSVIRYPVIDEFAGNDFALWEDLPNVITKYTRRGIRAIRRLVLVPTIGKVTFTRVERIFPHWRRASSDLHYFNPLIKPPAYVEMRGRRNDETPMPSSSELLIISNVNSVLEYRNALGNALSAVENERTTVINPSK